MLRIIRRFVKESAGMTYKKYHNCGILHEEDWIPGSGCRYPVFLLFVKKQDFPILFGIGKVVLEGRAVEVVFQKK